MRASEPPPGCRLKQRPPRPPCLRPRGAAVSAELPRKLTWAQTEGDPRGHGWGQLGHGPEDPEVGSLKCAEGKVEGGVTGASRDAAGPSLGVRRPLPEGEDPRKPGPRAGLDRAGLQRAGRCWAGEGRGGPHSEPSRGTL